MERKEMEITAVKQEEEREREMGLVAMEEKSTEEEEKQIKMEKSTVDVKGMEEMEEDLWTRGHFQVGRWYQLMFCSDNTSHKKIRKVLMWWSFNS